MERERLDDEDQSERETDVESAEAAYGDTGLNPNSDDQKDAHQAGSDEHV